MKPSPYSERFTIACNHSWEPAGGGSGFWVPAGGGSGFRVPAGGGSRGCTFSRPASNQLVFPLYGPILKCRTNGGMAKDPDDVDLRGRDPLQHLIVLSSGLSLRFTSPLSIPAGASLL